MKQNLKLQLRAIELLLLTTTYYSWTKPFLCVVMRTANKVFYNIDFSKLVSLEKMVWLLAVLVENSRGDDNKVCLHLFPFYLVGQFDSDDRHVLPCFYSFLQFVMEFVYSLIT